MGNKCAKKHTELIEREDELLDREDTYQQLLAATWRFLHTSDEKMDIQTVRLLIGALYGVERSIKDELLDVRLALILFANSRKTDPPAKTNH